MSKFSKTITKVIGKERHVFIVNGNSFFEVIERSKVFSFPDVHRCGNCGSDDLKLNCHVTKDDELQYEHIDCKSCKSQVNFGHRKKCDTVFLRPKKYNDGSIIKDENGNTLLDWKWPKQEVYNSYS